MRRGVVSSLVSLERGNEEERKEGRREGGKDRVEMGEMGEIGTCIVVVVVVGKYITEYQIRYDASFVNISLVHSLIHSAYSVQYAPPL